MQCICMHVQYINIAAPILAAPAFDTSPFAQTLPSASLRWEWSLTGIDNHHLQVHLLQEAEAVFLTLLIPAYWLKSLWHHVPQVIWVATMILAQSRNMKCIHHYISCGPLRTCSMWSQHLSRRGSLTLSLLSQGGPCRWSARESPFFFDSFISFYVLYVWYYREPPFLVGSSMSPPLNLSIPSIPTEATAGP